MKYNILFLFLFLGFLSCFSQDSIPYFNTKIAVNFKNNNLNGSSLYFKQKLAYLKKQDNLEEFLYAHLDYYLLNISSNSIEILTNTNNKLWRKAITNVEKTAQLHLLINSAFYLKRFGQIAASTKTYEKALNYFETQNIKNYDIVKNCYKVLANNYMRLGDYNRAEVILKNAISIAESSKNNNQIIAIYSSLSNLFNLINKPLKANSLLFKLLNNKKLKNKQKTTIYSKIATNYYNLKDFKKAFNYINRSNKLKPNLETQLLNSKLKGLIFYDKKQFQTANIHFIKAINFATKIYGNNDREVAKIRILMANSFTNFQYYNDALENYQIALAMLVSNFKPQNLKANPNKNNLYAENTLIDAFEGKASVFQLKKDTKNAIKNLELANNVANLLNETFTNQQAKLGQQTKNRTRTEKLINLYYQLYQDNFDNVYLEKAFYATEKNKATVLTTILGTKKVNQNFVNDSLFIKQKVLQKQIAILNKNILVEEIKNKKANVNFIKNQISAKTKLTTQLLLLEEEISKKYPFLKDKKQKITIAKIQKELLLDNQILISFFETQDNWYIFSITNNSGLQVRKLPNDKTLKTEIANYINLFFYNNGSALKNDINLYQKTAFYLFQKLLQPELKMNIKLLTIIPDNKLNFVAFDALLIKETTSSNFSNYPYLIKNVSLNNSFSATALWLQKKQKKISKKSNFLGYFPVFKNNTRDLQELPYTLEEQKQFSKYTSGKSLVLEHATKTHFLENFKDYNTIHLSTHASAGSFLQPAVIEFYDKTLYLPEIYGLNMQTDLLVLSACETGVGKMQKGEGVMSLARGFTYAGVKNLIVSLWKVNDKATSKLMQNFYKNYKKSNSKTAALHNAKIDYLNDANISNLKKSPYYWSSFVFVGNVESSSVSYLNYILIVSLLLVLLYFLLKKYR